MSFNSTLKQLPVPLIILASFAGLLLTLAQSLNPLWWVAWLGPALLVSTMLLARSENRRFLGLIAGVIAGVSMIGYYAMIMGWIGAIIVLLLKALLWSSAARLVATLVDQGRVFLAVLALPATIAAIDTLLITLSPHGSISSFAYSQMDALPIIQIASLGGAPAVTFLVLLASTWLGILLAKLLGTQVHNLAPATLGVAMFTGGALIFGFARLAGAPQATETNVVVMATDGVGYSADNWEVFQTVYGVEIEKNLQPGNIVLLPEAVLKLSEAEADQAAIQLAALSQKFSSTIVVGIVVDEGARITNRALITKDGAIEWYEKQHLIPGLEAGITPGATPLVTGGGLGVAICKDMHFPSLGQQYAGHGARLLLVPAYDFNVDSWMMSRATVLRGVETGLPIARATRNGSSFVSDPYGRVISEFKSRDSLHSLSVAAPSGLNGPTLYTRFGNVFGWICVLLLGGLILVSRAKMRVSSERIDATK